MRISDWSSDVCSSDLIGPRDACLIGGLIFLLGLLLHEVTARLEREAWLAGQILALQRAHTHAGMETRRVGDEAIERKRVVWGKSVYVRVDISGRRTINKKNISNAKNHNDKTRM